MLEQIAATIGNPSNIVRLNSQYIGFLRRNDGWATLNWDRGLEWCVFYFIEHGEVRMVHGPDTVTCLAGEGAFVGGFARPSVFFGDMLEMREIWFRLDPWPACMRTETAMSAVRKFRSPVEAAGLVDHLAADHPPADPAPATARYRIALLLTLCDQEVSSYERETRTLNRSQRVRLVRWVRANLASRPSPARVADVVGLSPDYFGRVFRNTFGEPPRDWLIRQRILAARRLLDETDLPTREVMKQCGFDDIAHFSRQMKRLTGKTPGGGRGWTQKRKRRSRPEEHN